MEALAVSVVWAVYDALAAWEVLAAGKDADVDTVDRTARNSRPRIRSIYDADRTATKRLRSTTLSDRMSCGA